MPDCKLFSFLLLDTYVAEPSGLGGNLHQQHEAPALSSLKNRKMPPYKHQSGTSSRAGGGGIYSISHRTGNM